MGSLDRPRLLCRLLASALEPDSRGICTRPPVPTRCRRTRVFNIVDGDIGLVAADFELTLRRGTRTVTPARSNPSVEDGPIQGA